MLSLRKRVSKFDSENLMHSLIEDVLQEGSFKQLGISTHVPLQMIIRDKSLLNFEEAQYIANVKTHVDFLVFDKISKVPKVVIEVDGVSFHKEGTKQAQRDNLKNEIFQKYELPLLRFRTDGSN